MKKPLFKLLLVAAVFTYTFSYSQKPNTKNVLVKYVQPPSKPLEDNIETYYSKIILNTANLGLSAGTEQKKLALEGYKRAASEEEADVLFKFTVTSANYDNAVKKVTYKKKINDSTEVEKTGGMYEVKAYLGTSVYARDLKHDKLLGSGAGDAAEKSYSSTTYSTYNEAVYASNENKSKQAKKLYVELFNERISAYNNQINNLYGYPKKNLYMPIARGKGRKFDYSDLEEAYEKFNKAADIYNKEGVNEEVKNKLAECIDIWNHAVTEYVPDKKKTRIGDKNIGHIHFNLAAAHFILQDWDKTTDHLTEVKETKGQQFHADNLEGIVSKLQTRYDNLADSSLGQ